MLELVQSALFYWRRFKDLKKRQVRSNHTFFITFFIKSTPYLTIPHFQMIMQAVSLGLLLSGALVTYKVFTLISNSESPIVVVLSGSMEPGVHRGDLLVLTNYDKSEKLVSGDIVVYKIPGRDIPIVHRIIKIHEDHDLGIDVLSKGDNNIPDDRELYGPGRNWLQRPMIIGRAFAFLPYAGMLTILMNDYPQLKYVLLSALSGIALIAGE